jgi:BMFP domain-containing protein YqiC
MANLSRDQMREYQRARRVRLKGLTPASRVAPVMDATTPREAILQAGDNELASIRAKMDAFGPSGVITKTHGRLDVLSREDFDARPSAPAPQPHSMVAVGGKPGRGLVSQAQGYPLPPDLAAVSAYTRAEEFRAQTTTMLAALAARADQQERRIAALETAAVDRRADVVNLARAAIGILRFGLTGRG